MRLCKSIVLAIALFASVQHGAGASERSQLAMWEMGISGNIQHPMMSTGDKLAEKRCQMRCGGKSGSTICSDSQTCDCSCNRQPICECK